MAAKIISITNQKGGAGKSTTTMLLAGGFARKHLRVFVADADKQRTATRWAKEAPDHLAVSRQCLSHGRLRRHHSPGNQESHRGL